MSAAFRQAIGRASRPFARADPSGALRTIRSIMEAATPLPLALVQTRHERLYVDGLVIEDETAVRLARAREDAGENAARFVQDAIEIGARVLDREQTGANAEFVKNEFERAAGELDARFVERARQVAERLDAKVDEAFGAENGHLTQALARHFSDESASAVQHRIKAVLDEVMTRSRADLVRQFSSADASNPLADFKQMSRAMMAQAAERQERQLREMTERLGILQAEVQRLHAERDKAEEVAAVAEKGAAKGRTYEEAVFEAVDDIARRQGDDCEAVGDTRGAGGRKGDVLVGIDACAGPARGTLVFEAKDRRLSRNAALAELDEALQTRGGDYALLVVPSEDELPARTHPLREYNGDKLLVVFDPEDGSTLALEVAYSLARARVLMAGASGDGLDADAMRAAIERALGSMEDVRRIKSQLTAATGGIEEARAILDSMATGVREQLGALQSLIAVAPEQD
jgi:uncharacterized small protein (DUF1192 family)